MNDKDYLCSEDKCSGCLACFNSCPQNAIVLSQNDKGFVVPKIDKDLCIDCHNCEKTCRNVSEQIIQNHSKTVYSAHTKNKILRSVSSSGGVFSEIAKYVLNNDGVVIGAAFDKNFNVQHVLIDKIDDLDTLRRSKYVQSNVGQIYKIVKDRLEKGTQILFSGTPCQVNALNAFLGKKYDNLFTIDVVCHGSCSPKIWNDYKIWLAEKIGKLKAFNFRSKQWSWNYHSITASGTSDDYDGKQEIDPYYRFFLADYILRPTCFDCKFRTLKRCSDITLGDFWGLKYFDKFNNHCEKGTSLVLINTDKGSFLLSQIKKNVCLMKQNMNQALKNQGLDHVSKPLAYDAFWAEYDYSKFESLCDKYIPVKVSKENRILYKYGRTVPFYSWLLARFLFRKMKSLYRLFFRRPREMMSNFFMYFPLLLAVIDFKPKFFHLDDDRSKNLGDEAQTLLIRKWIKTNYKGYSYYAFPQEMLVHKNFLYKMLKKSFNEDKDFIVFQSGYNTQDLGGRAEEYHEDILRLFPDAKIIFMPQTVFFREEKNKQKCIAHFNIAKKVLFLARDEISYDFAKEMFPKTKVVLYPDIVTTLIGKYNFSNERKGALFVIRDDGEKLFSDDELKICADKLQKLIPEKILFSNTILKDKGSKINRHIQRYVDKQIKEYSKYKVIITDKYHGTILALAANTPVVVLKTNDHKVSTGVKWFNGVCDDYVKYADNLDDAYELAKDFLFKDIEYKIAANFDSYYKSLVSVVSSI